MTANNLMQLNKAQLEAAAEHWSVQGTTKREIVDGLHEKDVSIADYFHVFGEKPKDAEEKKADAEETFNKASQDVIVKMTRANPYFETDGFTFTRTHPYVVMSRNKADAIIKEEEGFRLSTPEEARDYYRN